MANEKEFLGIERRGYCELCPDALPDRARTELALCPAVPACQISHTIHISRTVRALRNLNHSKQSSTSSTTTSKLVTYRITSQQHPMRKSNADSVLKAYNSCSLARWITSSPSAYTTPWPNPGEPSNSIGMCNRN